MQLQRGFFGYENGGLHGESCPLALIADSVPTPFYAYSLNCLRDRYRRLAGAFSPVPHLICYALKANSQAEMLRCLVAEGAGAEVVSGAELALAVAVGFDPDRIVMSGVGKTDMELEAGLRAGILLFIVESEGELQALDRMAGQMGRKVKVGIRINPDIDAETHPHISTGIQTAKFGLDPETAIDLYARRRDFPHLDLSAIHSHIGSQLTTIQPLEESSRLLAELVEKLQSIGVILTHVDWGGGLGIRYHEKEPPTFEDYAAQILPWAAASGLKLVLEPGRSLVGPTGVLVVRVSYVKRVHGRPVAVVDGGMSDLLRPALYDAYHEIVPVVPRGGDSTPLDVVGAVCESSDVFGRERRIGEVQPGDLIAILDTGAYGYSMSSNYNLRPRPAEVVIEDSRFRLVRQAETWDELVARELGGK